MMDLFDNGRDGEPTRDWNQLLREYRDAGWYPTLLSFMFDHMPGGRLAIQRQQRTEVEAIYARTLPRIVRYPTRPSNNGCLPIWLCSPDFPVFKNQRQTLRDVTINDGQHVHALALTPPRSRLKDRSLAKFIVDEQASLIAHTRCRRFHPEPVRDNDAYVFRYARKSEERGRIDGDAFFILPRTMSEVRDGPDLVGRESSIFAVRKRRTG